MAKKPAGGSKSPPRQTSPRVSTIASRILSGANPKPTKAQIKTIAASVMSQDQTKGQALKKR
ncbi:hypothetical protein ACFQ1E_20055 [Sphingomonas canadensis]|uniref:Uncharacterized protein n=1 Tax=Sphingomonas canadensis TaxID=1219257 RepID=A0ABW3HBZ4_9SPHN|nr:hypothetical protein [Sphingomonas canadensis]MCW3838455.1 hypothetical protein [Sphingomonas canadensis]